MKKHKWTYTDTIGFAVSMLGTIGLAFGAISSWKIVYESTTESLRFWFALAAFIIFVSLVAVIIMMWCVILFIRNPKHKEKIASLLKIK